MLKRPCHFYNTTGKCRFGRHCKFLHIGVEGERQSIHNQENGAVNKENPTPPDALQIDSSLTGLNQGKNEGINSNPAKSTVADSEPKLNSSENSSIQAEDEDINKEKADQGSLAEPKPIKSNLCRFYARHRYCRYGRSCRFEHSRPASAQNKGDVKARRQTDKQNEVEKKEEAEKEQELVTQDEENASGPGGNEVKKKRKVCYFIKRGYCKYGKSCQFLHPKEDVDILKGVSDLSVEGKVDQPSKEVKQVSTTRPIVKPANVGVFKRADISEEKVAELRQTEIRQIKRRFPKDSLKIVEEKDDSATFMFNFSPTDPDWPYDVRVFGIQITIPESYPLKIFTLTVPADQDLPETVRRYLEVCIQEWATQREKDGMDKGTTENYFRPFLRWLEKDIENIVTEGLKQLQRELSARAAGLEFISSTQLQQKVVKQPLDGDAESPEEGDQSSSGEEEEVGSEDVNQQPARVYRKKTAVEDEVYEGPLHDENEEETDEDSEEESEEEEGDGETEHKRPQISLETERRGTEMSFKNMMIWFTTTILMEKMRLEVKCERCHLITDFTTPPGRVNALVCGRCNSPMMVVFRAVLAHTYSSTFGYLDLDGCTGHDVILQDCQMSMGCASCSKDVLVKSVSPGQMKELWCRGCHMKMKFVTESVKLSVLAPSEIDLSKFSGKIHRVGTKSLRRVPKDPAIQEGKPLPDNGACKHYKKSYRWLRFPCCGKTYPCDLCHDDKEDHEMKYANRMICGFCCREQPFAVDKACLGCSSALTKVRTSHWEGGRGCRDKISMSKTDDKKYNNLNKTTSNKAKNLKEKNKGKKNTKLRHT